MAYNSVERNIMFKKRDLRSRILSVAVASALGVSCMAVAAAPVGGRSETTMLLRDAPVAAAPIAASGGTQFSVLSKATLLSGGDVVQSAMALTKPVHVSVVMNLRNETGMKAAIAAAHTGTGPHVMSNAQLASYLPTQAQAQAVADYLTRAGFTNVNITPNRMIVNATGSTAVVQSAFQTSLVKVRTHDGRDAFANSSAIHIPASLQGTVQAVLGLQTVHMAHTYDTVTVRAHYPQEFADIYGASALPPATDVNAAVWGWGSMQNSVNDLDDFMTNTGLSAGTVTVVCTDSNGYDAGGVVTDDPTCNHIDEGETEWSMDSQSILAMSGGVKSLTFYAAYGNSNDSLTNALNEIVTPTAGEPRAQVINASFGECERWEDINQGGDGAAQAQDALFQIADAQGQTVAVATGDHAANECYDNQADSASYPASSPYVVAVAGTTLSASSTTWGREVVWLRSGGSPSSFEVAQPWQAPLTYGTYTGMRGPDVAFDASPDSGEYVLLQGNYYAIGGTSLATPLFAGSWARILESNPSLGFAAPHLYTLPASVLHDVRAGNNRGYIAKPGWDWVSGLGSFDVGRAAAILAPAEPATHPNAAGH